MFMFLVTSKMNENNVFINEPAWNNNTVTSNNQTVKTEPNDYEAITLENITIKTEITPANELKLKYEFDNPVILSTEKVIIKEELNIDEVLYDESIRNTQNWGDVNDPLAVSPTKINQKLKCEICGGSFPQSRQLNNHLFIIHRPLTVTGSGAYCHKCNKWFPETKYPNHNPCFNYMRSIQNGKKMYSCEICDQDYTAVSLLKAHLVESHRPFIVQDTLNLPEAILKQIICKICGAVFPANKLLIHHLTVMHRPYTITGEGAFCTRCQIWFAEDKFKDHSPCVTPVQGVFPVFSCNICNTEFKMLHLLKTHMHVIHRPLSLEYLADAFCDACNRWFKEDNYTMHKCFRRSNIKTRNKYAYAFKCTICSKEFENDADIKKHLFNVHRPVIAFDCGDTVFCDFCKKCFNEDKFEMHIPCHSVDSKCVFCLITMPSKDHYLLHDLTWTKWRSYQCNLCNLNTQDMRLANLNQHMIYHGKKSIFRCVKCKFDFVSTENAEAHIECFHLGCRCVMDPCVCSTYNYDYYYEFVKQRNISDFRGNNKNLLENEIILIREEQYNSIESDIDVGHVKKEVNYNHFQPAGITNNVSMPSTSTSTSASTILEDFSNDSHSSESIFDTTSIESEISIKIKEEEIISSIDVVDVDFDKNNKEQINAVIPISENERIANVVIEKGSCGFGFTLVGQNPCKLGNVIPGSPAELAGLHNGDSVAEINGHNVLSFAHDTVVSLIKLCVTNLHMTIIFKMADGEVTKPTTDVVVLKSPETKKYKCNICNIQYAVERMLNKHLIRKHKPTIDVTEEKSKQFHCNKCRQDFVEYLKFVYHDPCAVKKLDRCTICLLTKPTLAHYELHKLLYRNEQYVCTICTPLNRVTLALSAMNEHRKTEHRKVGVFECLKCNLTFGAFDEINAHSMQHVNNDESMDRETYKLKQKEEGLFRCKYCKKAIGSAENLEVHEKTHEQPKHSCTVCGRKYIKLAKLKGHMLLHSKQSFACPKCECTFALKKHLRQHFKVHNEKKKFICDMCGQTFMLHTSVICHVASHTSEDLFRCGVCNIKFDKQGKLGAHMEIHNKDDTNPNKCTICGKYFTHKCKLIVHLRLHQSNVEANDFKIVEVTRNNVLRRTNRNRIKSSVDVEQIHLIQFEIENKQRSSRKRTQINYANSDKHIESRKEQIDKPAKKRKP